MQIEKDYSLFQKTYRLSPKDYSPSLKDYSLSLKDYSPSLKDYSPSLKDYNLSLKDYSPSLKDYNLSLKDYSTSLEDYSVSIKDYSLFKGYVVSSNAERGINRTNCILSRNADSRLILNTCLFAGFGIYRSTFISLKLEDEKIGWEPRGNGRWVYKNSVL